MTGPSQRVLDYLENIEYLLACGESPHRIAQRVGVTPDTIIRSALRYDRKHLAAPFYPLTVRK